MKLPLDYGLLYIEPTRRPSQEPIIDELTRKMAAAFRRTTIAETWRGHHTCSCGVSSSNSDYYLPDNETQTNSLCVHYLAFHRDEVPADHLAMIATFGWGEVEPTPDELQAPRRQP